MQLHTTVEMSQKLVNKMSELKRCPFCGGELGVRTWIAFAGESYSLKCSTKDCLFNVSSFKNKKDLIKNANTRKPMERIMERLEEQKKLYKEAHATATWTPDKIAYVNTSNGICKAIEIVKEEGETNE